MLLQVAVCMSAVLFVYQATDPSSLLVEHELDYVYAGVMEDWPSPDPAEVLDVQLIEPAVLSERLHDPLLTSMYTPWLADVMAIASGTEPARTSQSR